MIFLVLLLTRIILLPTLILTRLLTIIFYLVLTLFLYIQTYIASWEGLNVIENIFNDFLDISRLNRSLLSLLDICLNRNDFSFNKSWFLQTKGTTRGRKFAPSYANLFLFDWESNIFTNNHNNLAACIWRRFLDDSFDVWPYSRESSDNFLHYFNSINPHIQLTELLLIYTVLIS